MNTTKNNWISVKDRLPSNSEDVLVTDGTFRAIANMSIHGWASVMTKDRIAFWQPLPALPNPDAFEAFCLSHHVPNYPDLILVEGHYYDRRTIRELWDALKCEVESTKGQQ